MESAPRTMRTTTHAEAEAEPSCAAPCLFLMKYCCLLCATGWSLECNLLAAWISSASMKKHVAVPQPPGALDPTPEEKAPASSPSVPVAPGFEFSTALQGKANA